MPLQIAICTCERPGNYAPRTIASAAMQDPSGWHGALGRAAFVDGPDAGYLSPVAVHGIECVTHDGPRLGAYRNILRCLSAAHGKNERADVLLLEDDLVFASNWLRSLEALAEGHIRPYEPRFALAGYVPYMLASMYPGVPCGWYRAPFYASCCLWLSASILDECIDYLKVRGSQPMDLTLGDFFREARVALFGTTRSVAEHIGIHSTLGTQAVRRAHAFGAIEVPSCG